MDANERVGNDGLTDGERAFYAARYRERNARPHIGQSAIEAHHERRRMAARREGTTVSAVVRGKLEDYVQEEVEDQGDG